MRWNLTVASWCFTMPWISKGQKTASRDTSKTTTGCWMNSTNRKSNKCILLENMPTWWWEITAQPCNMSKTISKWTTRSLSQNILRETGQMKYNAPSRRRNTINCLANYPNGKWTLFPIRLHVASWSQPARVVERHVCWSTNWPHSCYSRTWNTNSSWCWHFQGRQPRNSNKGSWAW